MLAKFKKISMDQWFLFLAIVFTALLSFEFGYLVFRYEKLDICKSEMQVLDLDREIEVKVEREVF